MKISIVLHGTLKNKVVEREVTEDSLTSTINFINQHGLFEADAWYPPTRIKEIKFEKALGSRIPKISWIPSDIDDRQLEPHKE